MSVLSLVIMLGWCTLVHHVKIIFKNKTLPIITGPHLICASWHILAYKIEKMWLLICFSHTPANPITLHAGIKVLKQCLHCWQWSLWCSLRVLQALMALISMTKYAWCISYRCSLLLPQVDDLPVDRLPIVFFVLFVI